MIHDEGLWGYFCAFISVSEDAEVGWDEHFCYNLLCISHSHPLKAEFLAHEYLRNSCEPGQESATNSTHQAVRHPHFADDKPIGCGTENEK